MKKLSYVVLFLFLAVASCKKEDIPTGQKLNVVTVQLVYPTGSTLSTTAGVKIIMRSAVSSFEAETDGGGKALFLIPVGIYDVSATDIRSSGTQEYVYNGLKTGVSVTDSWTSGTVVPLDLTESKASQIVIKELFYGGTPKDDGSGHFAHDGYVVLYNNSNTVADLSKMCLGMIAPYNSNATNNYYGADGKLVYEAEGWIPAVQAFWYFQKNVTLQPGQQIVIALKNAINNTLVHTKSINFDNAQYYCTYDNLNFSHAASYVSPAASIPTNQYLKAQKYGAGTAWTLSVTTPGFFVFNLEGTTPEAFAADVSLTHTGSPAAYVSKKVPVEWVVDAVEAFLLNNANNKKRFTSNIDAGFVYHDNSYGYSIYRNVNKAATESIAGNSGKLVYSYSLGTTAVGGSTDASGIDAEASIKNGARIIYEDKNNSTIDYHLRSKAALSN